MIRFDDGTTSYFLGSCAEGDAERFSDREVRRVLARWLSSEPGRTQLRAFAEREIRVEARTDDALIDRVCALMDARGLRLGRKLRMSLDASSPHLGVEEHAEPLREMTREDDSHWIHVIVVDEDDQPLAGVRYRLELTDGRKREGRTGEDGGIYFDEIPAGECKLVLPDYANA